MTLRSLYDPGILYMHQRERIGLLLYVSDWSKMAMRLSDSEQRKTTIADSGRDVVIGGVFGR